MYKRQLETAPGDRRILADSIPAWQQIQDLSDRLILDLCGGLIIDQPESEPFRSAADAAAAQPRAHLLDAATLGSRYPQFAVDQREVGVLDELGGLADPQQAVAAVLELATAAGATVREHARVVALRSATQSVELEFSDGSSERFDRVVCAAGAFSRELLPELPIRSRRLLLGWFVPKPGPVSYTHLDVYKRQGGELPYARPVSRELFYLIEGRVRIEGELSLIHI